MITKEQVFSVFPEKREEWSRFPLYVYTNEEGEIVLASRTVGFGMIEASIIAEKEKLKQNIVT